MLVFDVIEETRRLLFTGGVEERNKLAASLTGVGVTPTFTYPMGGIDRGTKLSVDLEDMYVWAKSSQSATVDRAQFGSTIADHAAGSIVHVNSKFSNWEIFKAINTELVSLSSPANGLFQVADYLIDYNPVIHGYDFPYPVLDIYEVRYTTPGPTNEWYISQDWEFTNNSGADFASDKALFIRDAFPNQDVLVKAKAPFIQLAAAMAINISTSGLPVTCYDILAIGTAYRLTSPREVRRNFNEVQGDTRRAGEVPPGAQLGGSRELLRLRQERIQEEASRLSLQYPARSPRYPFVVG